jgi:hypothetical protein
MERRKEGSAFNNLRELAQRFDVQLGLDKRKLILAGNEKLTLATDGQGWTNWMAGVESRLKAFVGNEAARDLLVQTGLLTERSGLSAPGDNQTAMPL